MRLEHTREAAQSTIGAPTRPVIGPPADWNFPSARSFTLANGMQAVVHDVPGQYVISVRASIPLPLRSEPERIEGVAALMCRLLDEGTAANPGQSFAQQMEQTGMAMGAGMTEAGLGIDMDVPARRLGDALALMMEAVTQPDLAADDVARLVRTRLAEIEQERASAPHRAAREFAATFYDASERISRPSGGTHESVAAITREDVLDFHRRHMAPAGAAVVVAGDLTWIDIDALLAEHVGAWENPDAAPRDVITAPPQTAADRTRIVFVDRPGSVQSEFIVGCLGPDRQVEEAWAPFPVLAYLVGGSPTARIDAVLREERGYTYGIRSTFRPRVRGGQFLTHGSVRADATAESVRELLDILEGGLDGFSEAERGAGVDYLAKTAPGRYDTAGAIADEAAGLALEGLSSTFTSDNLRRIRALGVADLDAAWRAWIAPGEWTVVIVGDAADHAEAVRALGRGDVTVVPN